MTNINDKFSPNVICQLIPELEDNEQKLTKFIEFFKSFFDTEKKFSKFVYENNRYYIESLIIEFYDVFTTEIWKKDLWIK